jgi:hypothetical protein
MQEIIPDDEEVGSGYRMEYACNYCNKSVWLASWSAIIFNLFSGLATVIGLAYWLYNGLIDFVWSMFGEGILWSVLGVFLVIVFIVFSYGAILLISSSVRDISTRLYYPAVNSKTIKKQQLRKIITLLVLGISPWAIAVGLGLLNEAYFDIDKNFVILLMPVVFCPIFFAKKIGVRPVSVFLACFFWALLGGLIAWVM